MKINGEELVNGYTSKARIYVEDRRKSEALLNEGIEKLSSVIKNGEMDKLFNKGLEKVTLFIDMFKDYIRGEYKELPISSIIAIAAALLYFIAPFDLVPDFIPFVGYTDDIVVIGVVLKQIENDVIKYKSYKENKEC